MAYKPTDSLTVSFTILRIFEENNPCQFGRIVSRTGNESDEKLDKIGVYFNEANNFNYVPRSVNVDLVSVRPIMAFG